MKSYISKKENENCVCSQKNLLPFSALKIDPKTKKPLRKKVLLSEKKEKKHISYKASTFRPLTSEPFHKRFVKATRRGVPVFKFSDVKVINYFYYI